MAETKRTLIEWFPNYLSTDAVFTKMATLGAPWSSDVGQDMDDAYFTYYSGDKLATRFIKRHTLDGDVNALTIARILWGLYGNQWTRLWNAYTLEYKPLDNYNIKEVTDRDESDDRTISKIVTDTGTNSGTEDLEHGHVVTDTEETNQYNFGFNSTDPVPSAKASSSVTSTNSGIDKTTTSGEFDNKSIDDTTDMNVITEDVTKTRSGNIGQNTYQELMRQEIELWKWNFYTQVFEDVDDLLALSVFDNCEVNYGDI